MLGKRKRRSERNPQSPPQDSGSCDSESDGVREAFRRHFEARFQPLENVRAKAVEIFTPTQHTDSDSEWDGFSEPEGKIRLHRFYAIMLI